MLRVRTLAPRLVRVIAGGEGLDGFLGSGTDQHVKLYCYPPDVELPEPLTAETARSAMHRVRPAMRSYTIRRHDPAAREIDIDFVLHTEPGPASDWARHARRGDELIFVGPSPCYEPAVGAHTYLLAGDVSALPAIEAIVRELPPGTLGRVFVEVSDIAERRELVSPAALDVCWLTEGGGPDLLGALRAADLPREGVDAWVAGERSTVQAVRSYLLTELAIDRRRVRPTTYWRRGQIESEELVTAGRR